MIVCWSVKGGSGASIVTALCARIRSQLASTTVADLAGDQPGIFGLETRPTPGLKHWADASAHAPDGSLGKLAVPVDTNLHLIGTGVVGPVDVDAKLINIAARRMQSSGQVDIVDAGTITSASKLPAAVAASADESWLIIRPCYLALARAVAVPIRPTRLIVIEESGRSLGASDVESVLNIEADCVLKIDSALSRAVDSGRIASYKGRNLNALSKLVKETFNETPRIANSSYEFKPVGQFTTFPQDAA